MTEADDGAWLLVDEALVAVRKPSGELVVPGWARGERTTMTRVRDRLGAHVFPVHRLDRGTSGVVLFGRSPAAARALGERWGEVDKRYLALVRGRFPLGEVHVDHPVRRGERDSERVEAVTDLRGLAHASEARCSLVEARPRTGRLHQIRRHLKHLSHPIVGDVNYGDGRVNREFREVWGLRRLALHAASIRFPHPVTGAWCTVVAPLPDDLAAVLEALGLPITDDPPRASSTGAPSP